MMRTEVHNINWKWIQANEAEVDLALKEPRSIIVAISGDDMGMTLNEIELIAFNAIREKYNYSDGAFKTISVFLIRRPNGSTHTSSWSIVPCLPTWTDMMGDRIRASAAKFLAERAQAPISNVLCVTDVHGNLCRRSDGAAVHHGYTSFKPNTYWSATLRLSDGALWCDKIQELQ